MRPRTIILLLAGTLASTLLAVVVAALVVSREVSEIKGALDDAYFVEISYLKPLLWFVGIQVVGHGVVAYVYVRATKNSV